MHGGVSEGLDVGDLGEVKDSFGHTSFGSSQITVAQMIVNYLNARAGRQGRGAVQRVWHRSAQRDRLCFERRPGRGLRVGSEGC